MGSCCNEDGADTSEFPVSNTIPREGIQLEGTAYKDLENEYNRIIEEVSIEDPEKRVNALIHVEHNKREVV
jgi:hypothetical protein